MIVVVLINGIGDHYLAIPTLRALKGIAEDRIRYVGVNHVASSVWRAPEFMDVCGLEAEWTPRKGWSFDSAALTALLRGSTVIVSICPWESALLTDSLAHFESQYRIGFGDRFDVRLSLFPGGHAFDHAFAASQALSGQSLDISSFAQSTYLTANAARVKNSLLRLRRFGRIFAIHTETKAEKSIPASCWLTVLREIRAREPDANFLLLDRRLPENSLGGFLRKDPLVLHVGTLGIIEIEGVIAACDGFIGIDSCFLHVADLACTLGIGIFKSTSPEEFGFRFAPHIHVDASTNCSPESSILDAFSALFG